MTSSTVSAMPLRVMIRLHARERTGQVGHRAGVLAFGAGLIFLALGGYRLLTLTSSWQDLPATDVHPRLWLLMLASWVSIAGLSALHTLQTALHRQDIAILLPIPLDHGARWRLLLVRVASCFGPTLGLGFLLTALALSRFGIAWAVTFLLWFPASICLGALATLYVAWLSGNGSPRKRAIFITLAIPVTAVTLLVLLSRTPGQTLAPLALIPDAVLIPALVIGPGARRLGRWYLSLAQERYHAPTRARDFLGPVAGWLGAVLSRYRSPWAAIALKELRVQARDVFLLVRLAVMAGALPLYAVTHGVLLDRGVAPAALMAGYALILAVYSAIETTPSPFGGEGNRLTLALLCPASSRSLIDGKAVAVIAPLLTQTWMILLLLSIWNGIGFAAILPTGIAATIAVGSIGMIITCLSVRDIDLNTSVDGTSQALLVEHVPNRPMRLLIIAIALVLASGAAFAIMTLPWGISLPLVAVTGSMLTLMAFRDATHQLDQLRSS